MLDTKYHSKHDKTFCSSGYEHEVSEGANEIDVGHVEVDTSQSCIIYGAYSNPEGKAQGIATCRPSPKRNCIVGRKRMYVPIQYVYGYLLARDSQKNKSSYGHPAQTETSCQYIGGSL